MRFLLATAALIVLLALPSVNAGKYNLTKAVQSPLLVGHEPPQSTKCLLPGICFPANQTIPGQSFWYWCGFWSTHKTIYTVTSMSATTNFSGHWLMRRQVVEECAIPNLATVENCPVVPETACSKARNCSVRLFGMAFPDELCLVIINNKASNVVATIQVNNWYSSSRYYGTVFTIFLTVVGLLCVLAKVGWDFYVNIRAPVNKHKEPIRPRRNRDLTEQLLIPDGDAEKGKSDQQAAQDGEKQGGNKFFGGLRSLFARKSSA